MRPQDKRRVADQWRRGIHPATTARECNLPLDEVRAIYRKQQRSANNG